ncbi:hypothetical protein WJX74_005849 [Apatococcus lobatus]|uniref:STAS domain-containing protein n=1 Tax=Apatococcus lobatus TaxID=904363 RepID=A0AAW1RLU1_9CHLO
MQSSARRSLGSRTERLLLPVFEQTPQQQRSSFFRDHRHRLRHTVPSSQPDLPAFDSRNRITALLDRLRMTVCTRSLWDWLAVLVPLAGWLPRYKWRSRLWADLIAGMTIGVMVIPQAISYANLAGLPSRYGLHAAFVPVFIYAIWGSSRQLAVGPTAITSLILSNGLVDLIPGAEDNEDPNMPYDPGAQYAYNSVAIQVSLLAGLMYLAGASLRLGFLSNFLSHSVISGFTTGSAVIIFVSQLKFFLGISLHRHWHVYTSLYHLAVRILHGEADWREAALGAAWLFILLTMKHLGKTRRNWKWLRPLGPLTVTFLAIGLVWGFDLAADGIKVVGRVKGGLPDVSICRWIQPVADMADMTTTAALVTIVGLMESIAVAKSLADKNSYDINTNQELAGLGLANIAGAAFSAYPVAGSFSRSAVANDSGAKSGLFGIFSAALVGVVMTYLMPLIQHMPLNALAAIITSGVLGLFDYHEGFYLFKVNKLDWLVWMTSAISTVCLGVQVGLAISIGLALLLVIYESAFPRISVLGCLPQTTIYRNVAQYPTARTEDGLVVLRVDAPIYFANVQHVRDHIRKDYCTGDCEKGDLMPPSSIRYLILDCSSVTHIDAAGVRGLAGIQGSLVKCGIGFCLCNPSQDVVTIMDRAGLTDQLGKDHIFVEVQDAVDFCREAMATPRSFSPTSPSTGSQLEGQEALRRTLSVPVQHLARLPMNGYVRPPPI